MYNEQYLKYLELNKKIIHYEWLEQKYFSIIKNTCL